MKFNSLKVKVLTWFILITSAVIFLFSYLVYTLAVDSMNLKIQSKLYYYAQDTHDDMVEHGKDFHPDDMGFGDVKIAILENGVILKKTTNFDIKDYKKYLNQENHYFLNEIEDEKFSATYVLMFNKPFKGTILVNQVSAHEEFEEMEEILMVLVPLLIMVFIFVGVNLINKILNPIKKISDTVKDLDINNLPDNLDVKFKETELLELTDRFNEMLKRIKDGIEKMDRFNSDVSHELRTPLTVINTQIELALKKDRDKEYYVKSLENIFEESNKINLLVQNMLLLTRYSKENIKSSFELCDFNALLINTIEKFTPIANSKNIQIKIEKFEKCIKDANPSLITIVFSNLIDNSIKYSLENKTIHLYLFEDNGYIIFNIQDEGIGINKKYLDKITDRFYRVDESRNKKISGFGLGLSIVKNIIELHDGNIKIDSVENEGTTIEVSFT